MAQVVRRARFAAAKIEGLGEAPISAHEMGRVSLLAATLRSWPPLQRAVVIAGLASAILFIIVGLAFDLQLYADGSIFAYSVALQDSWAVHWHNISGRVTVYLASCWPAEALVALTGSARAGIVVYGFLFFSAQLVGLLAAYLADRSAGRTIFKAACFSTACLCPLVFGFPTEMWYAHALFWPTLALAHYARRDFAGHLMTLAAFVALVHTHGGGVIFAAVVVMTTALREPDGTFRRVLASFILAMAIWAAMQTAFRPDDQISPVLVRAAVNFIDPRNLLKPVMATLIVAAAGPTILCLILQRTGIRRPALAALSTTLTILIVYWVFFDDSFLAEDRYFLRSAVFYLSPLLGMIALLVALQRDGLIARRLDWLPRTDLGLDRWARSELAVGALALVLVVHVVETVKFVDGWTDYTNFVRKLADTSTIGPGEASFVSSTRIPVSLNEFSWSSTTHYLSVVAAPDLNPARLIVNPDEGYHWITCKLAKRHVGPSAIPDKARRLIEAHACKPS